MNQILHIPNASQELFLRGNALFNAGRYAEAIAYYDCAIAITLYRRFPAAQSNRELALQRLNQPLETQPEPVEAIASEPPKIVYVPGVALCQRDRYLEAIAAYDKVLTIDPDNHQAWRNRGNCLYNLNQQAAAVEAFEKAIAIMPTDWEAWRNRGLALYDLGEYEAAIASQNRAITIHPNDPYTWYSRGLALDDLGKCDEAEQSYTQAAILQPGFDSNWFYHDLFIT